MWKDYLKFIYMEENSDVLRVSIKNYIKKKFIDILKKIIIL